MSTAVTPYRAAVKAAKPIFEEIYGKQAKTKWTIEHANAAMIISESQRLQQCTPESITKSTCKLAQMDLTLNPSMSLAYLVPRKNRKAGTMEAKLMPSYMGLIEIARRSGAIADIHADVVIEGEPFEYRTGTSPFLNHTPSLDRDHNAQVKAVYCVVLYKDGTQHFEVKGPKWINARREVSESKNSEYSPWNKWLHSMCIKTIVRHTYKFMPKTPQMIEAIQMLDEADPANLGPAKPAPMPAMTTDQALQGIAGATTPAELKRVGEAMPDEVWKEVEDQYRAKEHELRGGA